MTSAKRSDIFIRGSLGPRRSVELIFRECCHIGQFERGEMRSLSVTHEQLEAQARQLACHAPVGFTYAHVFGELAECLCRRAAGRGAYKAAWRLWSEWCKSDPKAVDEIRHELLSPQGRRMKIRMEAKKDRREVELLVKREEWREQAERERRQWQEHKDKMFRRPGW